MPDSSSPAGDAESSSGLMLAIRKFFDPDHGERSLRAQLEEAIDQLTAAAAAPNSDPRYYFHLAVAYHRLGQKNQASAAFKQALSGKLTEFVLTPTEKAQLKSLSSEYR